MPLSKILLITIFIFSGLILLRFTYSYFSDSATSTGNTFAAAAVFPAASPTSTESPTPGPGDIVINELMWMGSSKGASDEWIELRNMTSNPVNIGGWQLTKWVTSGTDHEDLMLTIPADSQIPANGFFLIAQTAHSDAGSALNVAPNVITTSVTLSNSALQVRLFINNWNTGGTLIDTGGNKGSPLAGEHKTSQPKKFYSMERNTTPGDGTLAGNWHTATTSIGFDSGEDVENRGTPKSANSL